MTRPLALIAAAAALALAVTPAAAQAARIPIRVGIGDQQVSMFDQPSFRQANFQRVRYLVPWNVMDDPVALLIATAYVQRAHSEGKQVLLHVSTDDYRIKRARLPSVTAYRRAVGRIVSMFRPLGVRDFGVWNEANHASQPTWNSPGTAALFFREMFWAVKGRCPACGVIALDVLDQAGVERYMQRFYARLSPAFRARATIVGIHNYGDVNRRRTTFTRSIINQSRRFNRRTRFWLTETGGIVKFGTSFPCSTPRAADRLAWMFRLARQYRSSGVDRLYIYNWTGAGCDARFDAGLVAPDGTPRAAYRYLRRALPSYLR